MGLSPISAAQLFHDWEYKPRMPTGAQAAELTRLGWQWDPRLVTSAERVVINHLLRALPRPLQQAAGMRNPTTIGELVEAVELAEAAQHREAGERAPPFPRRVNQERRTLEGTSRPVNRPAAPGGQDEPMPTEAPRPENRVWLAGCAVHQEPPRDALRTEVKINGRPFQALLDTGSAIPTRSPLGVSPSRPNPAQLGDELLDRLGRARFISTLDLTKGYWQVELTKEAKPKTAFSTPSGHWQYRTLPFGLHGAPATFQGMMDILLRPHQAYAAAYLDDVVVHSERWEDHLERLWRVLLELRRAGLTANPKKCHLALSEAKYLGYQVGRGLIRSQEKKVAAILSAPRPSTKTQVRAFLGLAGYYRCFIPNFSSLAAPLTDLTRKGQPKKTPWGPTEEEAFHRIKTALTSEPVLRAPDFNCPFCSRRMHLTPGWEPSCPRQHVTNQPCHRSTTRTHSAHWEEEHTGAPHRRPHITCRVILCSRYTPQQQNQNH
ncbi:hypothetical protein QQF64_003388 [Cirrhinus molitorella]|uniref:ribonuclease H n=1 Tax=Cirrhinus molitorella TaxID=172907 RepID=A0ABR3ML54_9TELE